MIVTNRDTYVFEALTHAIDSLVDDDDREFGISVMDARSETPRVIPVALGDGTFDFGDHEIAFEVFEHEHVIPTDTRPEWPKTLVLRADDKSVLLDFVYSACAQYRVLRRAVSHSD